MVVSYQQAPTSDLESSIDTDLNNNGRTSSSSSWKKWGISIAVVSSVLVLGGINYYYYSSPSSVSSKSSMDHLLGHSHHKEKKTSTDKKKKDSHHNNNAKDEAHDEKDTKKGITTTTTTTDSKSSTEKDAPLLFDELRRFIFHDFDATAPVSSFLPGVAGVFGKPVWAFYVNRGQGIASFGVASKDFPILEFNSANKAYQLTPYIGFRTFIQGSRGGISSSTTKHNSVEDGTSFVFEPFSPSNTKGAMNALYEPERKMFVGTNEMEIDEIDIEHGVQTSVTYFVLPEENFAALVRKTTITNIGKDTLTFSALDGLAQLEPTGGKLNWGLKNIGRTLEGWMGVYHADDTHTLPFYRMSTEPSDSASVVVEKAGHYCIAFVEGVKDSLLPIVYDTNKIFGFSTTLQEPTALTKTTIEDIVSKPQYGDAKTSSAFAALLNVKLEPGENITITSVYGMADHIEMIPEIAAKVTAKGYSEALLHTARELIDTVTAAVETHTADHLFNGMVKQTYLDNSLRGGYPLILGGLDEDARSSNADEDSRLKVYHIFSRIHGDLERDYNDFNIDPTYFSQGPGNYRDVAQNRRNDVIFTPRMGSFVIRQFLSYIQADGYEPLTVEAVAYLVEDHAQAARVAATISADYNSSAIIGNILGGGIFRPGQIFNLFEQLDVKLAVTKMEAINEIMAISTETPMAVFGQGYWADHWEYYLDLIEAYTSIYPDGEESLMYDRPLKYFFSTATVKPRSEKYVVDFTFDGKSKHILQLDAAEFDTKKAAEQESFRNGTTGIIANDANWQRVDGGVAFKSSAIAKLFLLGAIKYATRDAYGMGVEYEGGRPGWNDAMNGLAGMVGSGMPETFELSEMLKYVKSVVVKYQRPIVIPFELGVMVDSINIALDELLSSGYTDPEELTQHVPKELFKYWNDVAAAREKYRKDSEYYFSGTTTEIAADDVITMLTAWFDQVQIGVGRAIQIGSKGIDDDGSSGIPPAYFSYTVTEWEENGEKNVKGYPLANPKAMKVGTFPAFLESPVRYMKLIQDDKKKMMDMYSKVLNSNLRDKLLKMYFISADLTGQSYDMGRMMAFSAGWLENQSIWMHMSYKYYLQLLRGKLYDEFYSEMKGGGMIPFMDPKIYGRSPMEFSSFIASSAFKDPSVVGRGFAARLSGSTAELLSIWRLMFIGPNPYIMNDKGKVEMQLIPAIPFWLFDAKDTPGKKDEDGNFIVGFKLFSTIPVTYHNTKGTDLFDVSPVKYIVTMEDGSSNQVDGATIPTKLAIMIRKLLFVATIDVYF